MPPARPTSVVRLATSALAVGALALAAVGCGGDEDVARADFQEKLIERTTIPEAVAACMTDRVYDQFDQSQINQIVWAATVDELRDAEEDLVVINDECFAEHDEGDEGTPSTEDTGSSDTDEPPSTEDEG